MPCFVSCAGPVIRFKRFNSLWHKRYIHRRSQITAHQRVKCCHIFGPGIVTPWTE
jgi:hypothetical protein